jgi:hypothetical protein
METALCAYAAAAPSEGAASRASRMNVRKKDFGIMIFSSG